MGDALFRAAVQHGPQGIALLAADGRIVFGNAALCRMLNGDAALLASKTLGAFLEPEPAPIDLREARHRLTIDPTPIRLERRYRPEGGPTRWGLLGFSLLNDADIGAVFAVHLHVVTERRSEEDRLRRLAFHDHVTGLPNHALCKDHLGAASHRVSAGAGELGVLLVDLDHFKAVNDAFGHDDGDHLLRVVADRLQASVEPGIPAPATGGTSSRS